MWEGTGRDTLKVLVAALFVMPLVVDQYGATPLGKTLSTRVVQKWGELTYGIFLIHLPLMGWMQSEHLRLTPELLPTLWLAVLALLGSTVLAAALFYGVEKPLQRLDPFRGASRRGGGKRSAGEPHDPGDGGSAATLTVGAKG